MLKNNNSQNPLDLSLSDFFGNPPKTVITDNTVLETYENPEISLEHLQEYLKNVLRMESVACKDWLTNKVDRSVTGKVARQQCAGEIQLPLNDCGVMALDYTGTAGIATSIGHAPLAAMISPEAGSQNAIAEALTNIVWANLKEGLRSVSLSANWMWACKNEGEDTRLYRAVEACSDFACALGINIPTGKDSLSMTQKYPTSPLPPPKEGENGSLQIYAKSELPQTPSPLGRAGVGFKVFAPGTVIISAGGEVADVKKTVSPVVVNNCDTTLYYIDFSFDKLKLGGSVLYQTLGKLGSETPEIADAEYFAACFNAIQTLVNEELILAGHDISAGGMISTLLEMCFANVNGGLAVDFSDLAEKDLLKILFAENAGVVVQIKDTKQAEKIFKENGVAFAKIGQPIAERRIEIRHKKDAYSFSINDLRDIWYETSYLLDKKQSGEICATARFNNYKKQPLVFEF